MTSKPSGNQPENKLLDEEDLVSEENAKGYEVGYGRPPATHRFKPGCSGNPKGRPKAKRGLGLQIHDTLSEEITIKKGNKRKRVSKAKAIIEVHVQKAMSGNVAALRALTPFFRDELAKESVNNESFRLSYEDEEMLKSYIRDRFGQGRSDGEED